MIFYHLGELKGQVIALRPGVGGIFDTLATMCQVKDQAKLDPNLRARVASLLLYAPERDERAKIETLFAYARDRVRYLADIVDVETLSDPETTIRIGAGDCDDKALLLATLLEVAGQPAGFIATGYSAPQVFEHVYVGAELADGSLLPLDPSENVPAGWEAPDAKAYFYTGARC